MEKTELYANARQYFFTGRYTQKEISKLAGVPERTLRNWVKEGNWHRLRENAGIAPAVILENFVNQLVEMQNHIAGRTKGYRFPKPEEAETQRKLFYCIINMKRYPTAEITSFGTGLAPVTDIVSPGEPALASEEQQMSFQEPLRTQFMPYESDGLEIIYHRLTSFEEDLEKAQHQLLIDEKEFAAGGHEAAKSGNDTATAPPFLPHHHHTAEASTIITPILTKTIPSMPDNAPPIWPAFSAAFSSRPSHPP